MSGKSYIPLPKVVALKKAIITMKNDDKKCFLWCVLRALDPIEKTTGRIDIALRNMENDLEIWNIKYPVTLKAR